MRQETITDQIKQKKFQKVRHQFTELFCCIVIPVFLIFVIPFYWMQKRGFFQGEQSRFLILLCVGAACLLLAFCAAYFLMNMIFRPLERLNAASLQIAKGDYSVRVNYDGRVEEIDNTIKNFNFMAQELNSVEMMRNDFIGNISHEFKTPLTSITGYATLLQDADLSEEERQIYIEKLFFNVEKLNDLTGNILALSRLENQSILSQPVSFRLDEQIREAIVVLEPKWSEKNTQLNIDLEEICYVGQKTLLFHVWQNLIGNAIKFTEQDGRVSISLAKISGELSVQISDDGVGMDEQTQAHIFEKFYQGDTSRRSHGNGLGLALCKEILDRCGGSVAVHSEIGSGTTFTVTLPEK